RDETTTVGSSLERASAARASRRLLTDSSKAGGRSRKETPTSEKTWREGLPASHGRSSSAKRSGAGTRITTDLRSTAHARANAAATIGQAGRGSRPTSSWDAAALTHRSKGGASAMVFSQSRLTPAPH